MKLGHAKIPQLVLQLGGGKYDPHASLSRCISDTEPITEASGEPQPGKPPQDIFSGCRPSDGDLSSVFASSPGSWHLGQITKGLHSKATLTKVHLPLTQGNSMGIPGD